MSFKEIKFPQDIYRQYLEVINRIKFTPREVDVIAFIANGRTTKKIASYLSISPKTVDNHIHNIMMKLECHSRENIIDFIENANKFLIVRQYYVSLLIKIAFKDKLKKISQLVGKKSSSCILIPCYPQSVQDFGSILIERLRRHLKFAGITTSLKTMQQYETLSPGLSHAFCHVVLIVADEQLKALANLTEVEEESSPILKLIQGRNENVSSNFFTFLVLNRESILIPKILSDIGYIEFRESDNYYLAFLNLLKRVFPSLDLDKIISQFTKDYALIGGTSTNTWPKIQRAFLKDVLDYGTRYLIKIRKYPLLCFVFFLCLFYAPFAMYSNFSDKAVTPFIRSDLSVPFEDTLLERPDLLSEIEKSFKGTQSLKITALVGIAGVGKTTLARQYVRSQKASVIWELNAETKETLFNSFENFAQALGTTEQDQRTLREIQEIKESKKREERIFQFVKGHLQLQQNWILIYDNVEAFQGLQNYLPQDNGTWGQGKVILTTRDSNIQNMRTIAAVIPINELTSPEKRSLFLKILNHGINQASSQKDEIDAFLRFIPPFPLDISVAAYYIKSTQITYEKYLKRLSEHKKDFINVSENILKGTNDYPKVRYSIITLSLDQLMELSKDFPYLLLFISLIDSQNIPRDLLESGINEVSVDDFIFNLKKYSLITNHSSSAHPWGTTFSIHRSTQAISLTHLMDRVALTLNTPLIQRITQNLEGYIKRPIEKEDLSQLRLLTPHYEAFLNHSQLISEEKKVGLLGDLGGMYLSLGKNGMAKQVLKDALLKLDAHDKIHPSHDAERARVLAYLGNAYGDLGSYEKAKDFLEQSLLLYKNHLPTNYKGTAWTLTYLGNVYRDLGNPEKAKERLEQSLLIYKNHLPENYAENARASAYLGIVYTILGDYRKAKAQLEQSLYLYKTHLSKNHVGVAWVSAHLGNAYGELGDYEKSRQLLEQSIRLYKEHFPEDHIKVGWALSYLGEVYRNLGECEKAKKALEQSMVIYKKHLPENHIVIAGIQVYLSDVYKDLGKYEKAKDLLEQSLTIYEKYFPANHPETAWAIAHLGDIFRIKGDFNKATSLLEKSLTIYRQHFSEDHNEIIWALERLKYTHDKVSDYKKDPKRE